MNLLKPAEITLAYFKCGIFGFQGSGKTYTAALLANGLLNRIDQKQVAFFDTETGSDFVLPQLKKKGFDVFQVKRRDFKSLIDSIDECTENKIPLLIIDSITHVWRELMDAYKKKLNRKAGLQFQDWALIKGEWQKYTDRFVNSNLHIVVCGRAGYDYDYDFNPDGTKDLIKTGTKMKAEGEFGFEPSLVIEMERLSRDQSEFQKITGDKKKKSRFKPTIGSEWIHRAHVLKDRADMINGKIFDYPTFDDFEPHFDFLNIGGSHIGVDTESDSQDLFEADTGRPDWKRKKIEKDILLEQIQNLLIAVHPSQSAKDKTGRLDLIESEFGKRSWTYVEEQQIEQLEKFLKTLEDIRALMQNPANDIDSVENYAKETK